MTGLVEFAAHCRRMAVAEHKPECHAKGRDSWGVTRIHPNPACAGCNHAGDRALFTRLADEVDDYLAGPPVEVDLFGETTPEPEGPQEPQKADLTASGVVSRVPGSQPCGPCRFEDHHGCAGTLTNPCPCCDLATFAPVGDDGADGGRG